MYWAILYDHLENKPCHLRNQNAKLKPSDTLYQFSLYDGDNQLMFTGVCTDNSSFAPMDYAEPLYGCTRIDYLDQRTGTWEML